MEDKIRDLKEERNHKLHTAKDIAKNAEDQKRVLTVEERGQITALHAEAKKLEGEIADWEEHMRISKQANDAYEATRVAQAPKAPAIQISEQPGETRGRIEFPRPYRVKELRAFKRAGESAQESEYRAYLSGQWLMASCFGNEMAKRWCRDHAVELRAQTEGVNSAGGALVPTEFATAVIDLREKYGVFRQNARVVAMGRDVMSVPRRTGGLTAYVVGENSDITESNKTWNNVNLTARKLGVLTKMSTELDQDAIINLADDIAAEFAYALAYFEDTAGFAGTGTNAFAGITGVTKKIEAVGSSGKSWVDASTGHDTFAEVDATDLALAMARCPAYALPGAKWYCSSVCKALVFDRLKGAAGGNTVQTLEGKFVDNYLGYPIVVSQALPTSTTTINDTTLLLFGDLTKAAMMGDRRGITVSRSDERYFESDMVGLKATERIDIVVHDPGDTSTAGPLIALIGCTS